MAIPNEIPANARVVVRVSEGVESDRPSHEYRDYVGHVTSWDGHTLDIIRDAAANGSRPEHRVTIDADTIITLKPVPNATSPAPELWCRQAPSRRWAD